MIDTHHSVSICTAAVEAAHSRTLRGGSQLHHASSLGAALPPTPECRLSARFGRRLKEVCAAIRTPAAAAAAAAAAPLRWRHRSLRPSLAALALRALRRARRRGRPSPPRTSSRRPSAAQNARLAASVRPSGACGLPFAACGLPFGRPWLSAGAPSSRSSAGPLRVPGAAPPLAAPGFAGAAVAFGSLAAPPPWGGARQWPPIGGPFSRRARPTLGGLRWCRKGGRYTYSPTHSPADRGRSQAVARERLTRGHCRCIIQMLFSVPHSSCVAHSTSPRTGDKE